MYTQIWHDRNIPFWTSLLSRFKEQSGLKFLEIGCFEGRATVWLLENILTDNTSTIDVIDTFKGSKEHIGLDGKQLETNFMENIQCFVDRVTIYKDKSKNILPKLKKRDYHFIYVDGSHEALDVLRDGVLAFDLLKKGGVIIFDDYGWGPDRIERDRPYEAIQALIKIWGGFYGKWQFNLDQAIFIKD